MLPGALVGRDRELAVLRDAAARAVAGAGGVLVVRGDPGIGKSAVIEATLDSVDGTRFVGHAIPGGHPGRALAELTVTALAAGASMDHPRVALFRPPLAALIGSATFDPDLAAQPVDLRSAGSSSWGAAVGEGLLRLLETAADRPVAVLEDRHWADPDTQNAVEYIADHLHGRHLALILTHRPGENDEADALTVRVGRSRRATTVDLSPLSGAAVDEMIVGRLGGAPAPSRLMADVRAFAEGVPLLVEEFLSAAQAAESLRMVDRAWRYEPGRRGAARRGPPESLRQSIEVPWAGSIRSDDNFWWPARCSAAPSTPAWSPAACVWIRGRSRPRFGPPIVVAWSGPAAGPIRSPSGTR